MIDPYDDLRRADIKGLDPLPAAESRRPPPWELILGLLLILGVAGFALISWWQQQHQVTAYRAGTRAATAQNWDAARAAYLDAGDYADARARATEIAGKITLRDQQYALALAAERAGDWGGLAAAVAPLRDLAPHYGDAPRLLDEVESHVYLPALSGTVALRPAASPPGLYTYGAARWQWLTGSDAASRLVGECAGGNLLYDGPVAGERQPQRPTPAPGSPYTLEHDMTGRQLLVASPSGHVRTTLRGRIALAEDYGCDAAGVWGMSYLREGLPGAGEEDTPATGALDFVAQPFDSPAPIAPALPGPAWYVVGVAPGGRQILLIDATDVTRQNWHSRLFMARADGSARHLLGDRPGLPSGEVSFSPDGRFVVLQVFQPAPGGAHQVLVLLDTTGTAPPVTLVDALHPADRSNFWSPVSGHFLAAGPHRGALAVTVCTAEFTIFRLLDPQHPTGAPLLEYFLHAPVDFLHVADARSADGSLLLVATSNAPRGGGWRNGLIYLAPDGQAQTTRIDMGDSEWIAGATLRGGRAIYRISVFPPGQQTRRLTLHSLARPLPADAAGAVALYQSELLAFDAGVQQFAFGDQLLAYLAPGGGLLRARSYDGQHDWLLEAGVQALYRPTELDNP